MKKHWKIFRKNSMEIFRNFPEKYEIFWTNFPPHITIHFCSTLNPHNSSICNLSKTHLPELSPDVQASSHHSYPQITPLVKNPRVNPLRHSITNLQLPLQYSQPNYLRELFIIQLYSIILLSQFFLTPGDYSSEVRGLVSFLCHL